jgi:hypothetical protein
MFGADHYVPILKWRQGEYLALRRSSTAVKDSITPVLEIPLEPWDFEAEAPAKSLDQHLEKFGKRLYDNWGARRCFVDSPFFEGDATMDDGTHHLVRAFDLAREFDTAPVPTTGLQRRADYQHAVAQIEAVDARGVCLRLHPEDLETNVRTRVRRLLADLGPGYLDLSSSWRESPCREHVPPVSVNANSTHSTRASSRTRRDSDPPLRSLRFF